MALQSLGKRANLSLQPCDLVNQPNSLSTPTESLSHKGVARAGRHPSAGKDHVDFGWSDSWMEFPVITQQTASVQTCQPSTG